MDLGVPDTTRDEIWRLFQTWDWFSGKPRQHSLSLFVLIMPSEKILWTDGVALILVA